MTRINTRKIRKRSRLSGGNFIIIGSIVILLGIIVAFVLINSNNYSISFHVDETTLQLAYGSEFVPPKVSAVGKGTFFNTKSQDLTVSVDGDVDMNKIGEYELTYTAKYKGEKKKYHVTVQVADQTPPEITLKDNPDNITPKGGEYQEDGYTAVDNLDGDITDKVTSSVADGKVIYTVTDSSGNTQTVERIIRYEDLTPPVLTIVGDAAMTIERGSEFVDQGCTATDDTDGDISAKVTASGGVDPNTNGKYTITYSVTDNAGNTASIDRTVVVTNKLVAPATIELVKPDANIINTEPDNEKNIYLTFDDGPYKYTEKLLDVLDKYNAKATFFVTNQYPEYNYMIAEEAKRGHTVAIHTYSHSYETIYQSLDAYYTDLNTMSDIIYQQTGKHPGLIRFPGGSSNTVSANHCEGIMTALAQDLTNKGYLYADWNVSSGDAVSTTDSGQVAANVINGVQMNRRSAIVLQHDIKEFSVDAVEQILQWGQANGYTFRAMDDATPMVHHGINN